MQTNVKKGCFEDICSCFRILERLKRNRRENKQNLKNKELRHTIVQDFRSIKEECLKKGKLWEDPEFEAKDSSISFNQGSKLCDGVVWKRPGEIVKEPQFFVEGVSRFDVLQGDLADCWLAVAMANLTLHPELFSRVVPGDQGFADNYAGIFLFRFWQFGMWREVVVDDRLPTRNGKLAYLHSSEKNEFWAALMEKAYAKMQGSYEALDGGNTSEAMEDFTSGISEVYTLEQAPLDLFRTMLRAHSGYCLMSCSIKNLTGEEREKKTAEGLVRGHAFSITGVRLVVRSKSSPLGVKGTFSSIPCVSENQVPLLRLRNPWGDGFEWTGPWSDKSPEWQNIPSSEKDALGLVSKADGEFWMSYLDFLIHFTKLEICSLRPDSGVGPPEACAFWWQAREIHGEWKGVTAGGCENHPETFSRNPRFRVALTSSEDRDGDGICTVIVGLMQKSRKAERQLGKPLVFIGFYVFKDVDGPDGSPSDCLSMDNKVAQHPCFLNRRGISCRLQLPLGCYCVVPTTFLPRQEGKFLLRIFTERKVVRESA